MNKLRSRVETDAINRMLQSHGLGRLEDGAGLLAQLGFVVQDHEHFRSLVARCDPERRSAMYDALKPNVRFPLHPLDWYIAESARKAEAGGLPTLDAQGNYHWPNPVSSEADIAAAQKSTGELFGTAQDAVDQAFSKWSLEVVCSKCTKTETFVGARKADAVQRAREAGWTYDEILGKGGREICPECPATRRPEPLIGQREEFALVNEFKMQPMAVIASYMEIAPGMTKTDMDAAALDAARRWARDGKPNLTDAN